MSWRSKVRMYQLRGFSEENAIKNVLDDYEKQFREMDERLAQCISHMSQDAVKEVFGDLK